MGNFHGMIVVPKPTVEGKNAIVTGSSSGVGKETALDLGCHGANVILACRNEEKAKKTVEELLDRCSKKSPDGKCPGKFEQMLLDTSDLSSVRSFAEKVNARNEPIDILVNNAGIMCVPKREESKDGFELQTATNHLGHFALTGLLMPSLEKSHGISQQNNPKREAGHARVVFVSSLLAHFGDWKKLPVDFKYQREYDPENCYSDTKLANLLTQQVLAHRFPKLEVTAAHPGGTSTGLQKYAYNEWYVQALLMNAQQGAQPIIRAASDPTAVSGDYFGPCFGSFGWATKGCYRPWQAADDDLCQMVWQASCNATGVKY